MTLEMMARGPGLEQDHTGLSSRSRAAGRTRERGGGGGFWNKRKVTVHKAFHNVHRLRQEGKQNTSPTLLSDNNESGNS